MARPSHDIAAEYKAAIRNHLGTYLDLTFASGEMARSWMNWHLQALEGPGHLFASPEAALNPVVSYGGPEGPEMSATSLRELIARNKPGGRNWQLLGWMFVVMVYELWEGHFRAKLAEAQSRAPADVVHHAFGELRHLRRSIIHRGGRAVPEAASATLIPRISEGQVIELGYEDLLTIVQVLEKAIDELVSEA